MKKLVCWVFSLFPVLSSVGQNIYVHTTDGATHTYPLIDVNSITFSDNVMNLNLVTEDTVSWNISTVKFYEYDQWYLSVPDGLVVDDQGLNVFPNPASNEVNVRFNLLQDTPLQINIYSISGALVKTVFTGTRQAGIQNFNWSCNESDSGPISNGTYLVRVAIGNAQFNKLLIINK